MVDVVVRPVWPCRAPTGVGHARRCSFLSAGPVVTSSRADVPVARPYSRGSLARVGLHQGEGDALFEEADRRFLEERYARTSKAPVEARWKTWQKLCAATKVDIPAVAQALRSINRGLGPRKAKRDLFLDSVPEDLGISWCNVRLQVPQEQQLPRRLLAVIVASWLMLRGLEFANFKCGDVVFNRGDRQVKLSLPVSKVDPACRRVHSCFRDRRHLPSCTSPCALEVLFTPWQTCVCSVPRSS